MITESNLQLTRQFQETLRSIFQFYPKKNMGHESRMFDPRAPTYGTKIGHPIPRDTIFRPMANSFINLYLADVR